MHGGLFTRAPAAQIGLQLRREFPLDQFLPQRPLFFGRHRGRLPDLAAFHDQDRLTVPVEDAVVRDAGNAPAGRNDTDQVQGIGRADGDQRALLLFPADASQERDGLAQSVLLAPDPVHETSAADFAPGFHPSQHPHQVPPRRGGVLPLREPPEHYAVPGECDAGIGLEILFRIALVRRSGGQSPPAGRRQVEGVPAFPSPPRLPVTRRRQQGPEARETVGGRHARRYQLRHGFLGVCPKETGLRGDIVEKHRALPGHQVQHRLRVGGQGKVFIARHAAQGHPKRPVHAVDDGNGRRPDRTGRLPVLAAGTVGTEPSPGVLAGEAQVVEPGIVVVGNAGGKDLALPRRGRRLNALQHAEHSGHGVGTLQPGIGRQVMPGEEELHEVRG